jgi:hypothetical protein
MPIAVAASVSAAGKRSNINKNKKVPSKYLHLHLEKLQLEHELTTKFPATEEILFDKDLELLMMNGCVAVSSFFY